MGSSAAIHALLLVVLGLCIPVQAPALPLYIAFAQLGALNTYFSMMAPFWFWRLMTGH